jgi:hypothetical protein
VRGSCWQGIVVSRIIFNCARLFRSELAYEKRPNGGNPPIRINSSGDVF